MHKQLNVAPLSSIGSLGVRRRLWKKIIRFYFSHCFPNPLVSSVPQISVLIASFIVGTRRIVLVPTIIRSKRHSVVVYVDAVSVRPTVPAGVTNMFPIDPLEQPICRSF